MLCDGNEEYSVEMGDSPKGNARRVINFIDAFKKVVDSLNDERYDTVNKIARIKREIDHPDETNKIKLREREEDLAKLRLLIQSKDHS